MPKEKRNVFEDNMKDRLASKLGVYKDVAKKAGKDFDTYFERVKRLFSSERVRNFVFAPFKKLLQPRDESTDEQVRSTITMVAVANAVMAGLPGKLGVGVWVCVAFEAWMAYKIARHVGVKVESGRDVLKYFGLVSGVGLTILWAFRHLLGLGFSLFSIIPWMNPLIIAEIFVTDFVGVLFWVGFVEAKTTGSFKVPKRALAGAGRETYDLFKHQWGILKKVLTPENWKKVGKRLWAWMNGDLIVRPPKIKDDAVVAICAALLMAGEYERLEGNVGKMFVDSIKAGFPSLANASIDEIADHMRMYSEDELSGVLSNIKGRFFEQMVVAAENADGDEWVARLHDDPYHPSTDAVIINTDSGDSFEVSIKAGSEDYVEHALARYPQDPIIATSEAAEGFEDDERVKSGGVSDEDLESLTEEEFDRLLEETDFHTEGVEVTSTDVDFHPEQAIGFGTGIAAGVMLWPFVAAYMRKKITKDQMTKACKKCFGTAGVRLAKHIAGTVFLGPIYIWYLIAKTSVSLTKQAEDLGQ